MIKKALFILIGILMATAIFASDSELTGKDIAAEGTVNNLEGTFEIEDSEWYLRTENQLYIVHKGPDWYTEEIGFLPPEGQQVVVEGFVLGNTISPCTITSDNTLYAFRSSEGDPLWRGRGNRSNERYPEDSHEEEKG